MVLKLTTCIRSADAKAGELQYSEDDLEMQARLLGNVGLIAGVHTEQLTTHTMSETVANWAREDRIKFVNKWGRQPW